MMPKVPDMERDEGSLGSGGQTAFAASNRLWTPDMDKRPPSLAEQQIESVRQRVAAGEHLDKRPPPVLPNYQFNFQIPIAPLPLGPNPQIKPGKPGEKLGMR